MDFFLKKSLLHLIPLHFSPRPTERQSFNSDGFSNSKMVAYSLKEFLVMTILYTNFYEVIGLKCCFYVFFLMLIKINNFWSLECSSLHFPAMPLLYLGKAGLGVPCHAAARPWNISLSYCKAETSKASNAYWMSRKVPEVTQPWTKGTGGPHLLTSNPGLCIFSFLSAPLQTPSLQLCGIRPPIKFCFQVKAGSSCFVRWPAFP